VVYGEGAAKFYDLFGEKEDVGFYLDLARRYEGTVLELGVGTARLAIELARAGIDTWGIDNSRPMLEAARSNLEKESDPIRQRVHLEYGDVRNFDLDTTFDLVYFPSFGFDHLVTRNEQVAALGCIRRHLSPDGVYAFDLAHVPELDEKQDWFVNHKSPDRGKTIVRVGLQQTGPKRRVVKTNIWYELYEEGRMVEKYYESGESYIHEPEALKHLLEENGFHVKAMYSDHDRNPFTEDSEMMVVIAKA
jgi:SAM-dependent methyltransferase